jgi:hypothetical protein
MDGVGTGKEEREEYYVVVSKTFRSENEGYQAGGHDKLGFVPRDLYNFVAEYKKKKTEGRDAQYMLNYIASQKDKGCRLFLQA